MQLTSANARAKYGEENVDADDAVARVALDVDGNGREEERDEDENQLVVAGHDCRKPIVSCN